MFELLFLPLLCTIIFFQASDPIIEKLYASSEEGQKVTRNNGDKFLAVFKRIADPYDNQT